MAMLESLTFKDLSGRSRMIRFITQETEASPREFQTTIITGRNGSHKSTLLRELVAALTVPGNESSIQFLGRSDVQTCSCSHDGCGAWGYRWFSS